MLFVISALIATASAMKTDKQLHAQAFTLAQASSSAHA